MKIYLFAALSASAVILSSCGGGGKLNEKTALKVLQEAKEPVRMTQNMLTNYGSGHYHDHKIYYASYKEAGLFGDYSSKPNPINNDFLLNTEMVKKKGWDEYLEIKPASGGGEVVTVYNYMSRPGKVLRVNSNPVDRLCDAVVDFSYERYDYAPWGKALEKKIWPKPNVYEACMIKYDKSWGLKNTRKKR